MSAALLSKKRLIELWCRNSSSRALDCWREVSDFKASVAQLEEVSLLCPSRCGSRSFPSSNTYIHYTSMHIYIPIEDIPPHVIDDVCQNPSVPIRRCKSASKRNIVSQSLILCHLPSCRNASGLGLLSQYACARILWAHEPQPGHAKARLISRVPKCNWYPCLFHYIRGAVGCRPLDEKEVKKSTSLITIAHWIHFLRF